MNQKLLTQSKTFPRLPGVYMMKDAQEKIIYVGKSKNLNSRIKSYFSKNAKNIFIISGTKTLSYLTTDTEVDALLLEASLIKKHRPKYNIRLKDDKAYPYIKLSQKDNFPRLYLVRRVCTDGNLYFGPYTSGFQATEIINFLNKNFKIRDCSDPNFKTRKKPCITFQMGYCKAPCVGKTKENSYKLQINKAINFLRGKNKALINELKTRMQREAKSERFEAASKTRDNLFAIEKILKSQPKVSKKSKIDQDVLGYFNDAQGTMISLMIIRRGRKITTRNFFHSVKEIDFEDNARVWLVNFLNQYYLDNIVPDEILLPVDLSRSLLALLKKAIEKRHRKKIVIKFGSSPSESKLIQMALLKAHDKFKEHVSRLDKKLKALEEIKTKFKLSKLPKKIECYDISNFQASARVGSLVFLNNGELDKTRYRKFKIRNKKLSDYDFLKEVLTRRMKYGDFPDLILVDGGKGQLNVALSVTQPLNIPTVAIAKAKTKSDFQNVDLDKSVDRFFLPNRKNPVFFKSNSESFKLLTTLRDEAHRFAITYHKKLRGRKSITSSLDNLKLGESKKLKLLNYFGTFEKLKKANIKQIMDVPGFGKVLSKKVINAFKN